MRHRINQQISRALLVADDEYVAELAEQKPTPLDSKSVESILQKIMAQRNPLPASDAIELQPRLPVRASSRFRRRSIVAAGMFTLMAASIVILIAPWRLRSLGGAVCPSYQISVPGEDQVLGPSGPASRPSRLHMDSVLTVELRPDHQPTLDLKAVAFLVHDGTMHPWNVRFNRTSTGLFRLQGQVHDFPELTPGHWEIVVVIGEPGYLPDEVEVSSALRANGAAGHGRWQLTHAEIDVVQH